MAGGEFRNDFAMFFARQKKYITSGEAGEGYGKLLVRPTAPERGGRH
jgi:hypothetical protein